MSIFSVPNVFANGTTGASTVVDATSINANFTALVAAGNNINNQNIGVLGIYPSQLIPLTNGEAAFGGSAAITYNFPGAAITGAGAPVVAAGDLAASRNTSSGALQLGGASAQGTFDFGVNHPNAFTAASPVFGTSIGFYAPICSLSGTSSGPTAKIADGQITCTFTASQSAAAASVSLSGNASQSSTAYLVSLTLSSATTASGFPYTPLVGVKSTSGFTVSAFQSAVVTGTHTYDVIVYGQ